MLIRYLAVSISFGTVIFNFSFMLTFRKFTSFLLLFLILGCDNQKSSEENTLVDIPEESYANFAFSELIEPDFELIPLELGNSSGLKAPDKGVIKDDFFFLGDPRFSRYVLVFDLKKKIQYKSPFQFGEGPNAFSEINDFLIWEDQLMVLDGVKRRIAVYTIEQEEIIFQKSIPMDFSAHRFAFDGDYGYFLNAAGTDALITITDETFTPIKTYSEKNAGHLLKPRNSFHKVTINGKETILFHATFDAQIYKADEGSISPWRKFIFSNSNADIDLGKFPIQSTEFQVFHDQLKPFNSRFTSFEKSEDNSHVLLYYRNDIQKIAIRSENLDINLSLLNIDNDITFTTNIPIVIGTHYGKYISITSVDEINQEAPTFSGSQVERYLRVNPEIEYFLIMYQFR
jgi:hypothetical protein